MNLDIALPLKNDKGNACWLCRKREGDMMLPVQNIHHPFPAVLSKRILDHNQDPYEISSKSSGFIDSDI